MQQAKHFNGFNFVLSTTAAAILIRQSPGENCRRKSNLQPIAGIDAHRLVRCGHAVYHNSEFNRVARNVGVFTDG
jgi:hypothetical protein